jgi:hypothetical protein
MPRKVFTPGEVLAAADVNSFLMDQTVMTFAGTAARGSAIGTATEGMVSYLTDIDALQVNNGTAWITNRPIMVFADSSARSSAIPSPTEGMTTYQLDTNFIDTYSGTAWVQTVSNNAFVGYTPTLSAGSGSFTTASASGAFKLVGKTCHVTFLVNITTNGTAGTFVQITLPVTQAGNNFIGAYRENNVTGAMGQVFVNGNTARVFTIGNAYPGGNSHGIIGSFTYEVA